MDSTGTQSFVGVALVSGGFAKTSSGLGNEAARASGVRQHLMEARLSKPAAAFWSRGSDLNAIGDLPVHALRPLRERQTLTETLEYQFHLTNTSPEVHGVEIASY
jgi:hypothetical protein